jgi:VanZ family protein
MKPPSAKLAWTSCFTVSLMALTAASLIPIDRLPPMALDIWDKTQHALGFGWLMFSGLMARSEKARPAVLAAFLAAWGLLIECLQAWSGWRNGEAADLIADVIGIAVVWWVWFMAAPKHQARDT